MLTLDIVLNLTHTFHHQPLVSQLCADQKYCSIYKEKKIPVMTKRRNALHLSSNTAA